MVMAQIPALFLPKRSDSDKKTTVKKTPSKKRQFDKREKKQTNRVALLLT
jgi:hypothetical protein